MHIEYTVSQRGKELLLCEEFIYTKHSESEIGTRWRCQTRKCKGSIVLSNNNEVISFVVHCHEKRKLEIEAIKIKNNINYKAINTKEQSNNIIIYEIKNRNDEIVQILPKIKTLRDSISRKRNQICGFVPNRTNDIPLELHYDIRGEVFFRFDSGVNDSSRIVIFASNFKERFIRDSAIWLIDGTFKCAPKDFMQILTIHGYFLGRSYPLIYIFLKDKNEKTYERVFDIIIKLFNPSPKAIITDFEKALINSVAKKFPASKSYTCLFHLGQSIWRWIQTNGYVKKYRENKDIRIAISYCLNLAFVPEKNVHEIYNQVKKWMLKKELYELQDFLKYFERLYIGIIDDNLNVIMKSIYELSSWNAYFRILNNIPRTTNSVEGWHRAFNAKNEISHPNIARLISKMKDEEEINRYIITQSLSGKIELSRKNLAKEEKLRVCLIGYNFFNGIEFLDVINEIYDWKFNE